MATICLAKIFKSYNSVNYFISRSKPYNPNGRLQTESESDKIANEIKALLGKYDVEYTEVSGNTVGYDKIVADVYCSKFSTDQQCESTHP